MWWLPCEDGNVLLTNMEHLATGLEVDLEVVRLATSRDAAAYRQQLVGRVYRKLGERQQDTLLVMDNATNARQLSDYLHGRPQNV